MVANAGPGDPSRIGAHLSLVAQPSEKRRGGDRGKMMMPATIVCPGGVTFACVIRDMSMTGAKISVSRRHRLPPDFLLAVSGSTLDYPVHLAWQRADFAGVTLAVSRPEPEAE